jgi:8-amino-7-oxononanoate synthase
VDLCSNDYLNLARHPLVTSRFMAGVAREGCGSTGSRLLSGQREAFEAIERRFADFKGTERSLYFAAGYLANLAVLTTLPDEGDEVFSDALNHASVIDGARLSRARTIVFPHNDAAALRRLIAATDTPGIPFIVVESLFSMDGDMAPLAEYAAIARDSGAVLIVDEAHAVGIYGARGSGLIEEAGVAGDVCLSINTAGKALGVSGAFLTGASWTIEYLLQRARTFLFSTAPPPALADAVGASLSIVDAEPARRTRLLARARYLRDRLADAGVDVPAGRSQIVPIVIGDNDAAMAVARVLQGEGFDVRPIRPPSVPEGTARLRVTVNADLTEDVIDRFVEVLAATLKEARLCAASS